jgi:hypothetical protein
MIASQTVTVEKTDYSKRNRTEGGTRTHTVLPPLDFESSASTSSATSANI